MSIHKTHPGLIDRAKALPKPGGFVRSVLQQYAQRGTLSVKQADALANIVKASQANAAKVDTREAAAPQVDALRLHAMFDTAKENGLERLKFRMESFTISPAPAGGVNAGALYVKGNPSKNYYGKLVRGRFVPARDIPEDMPADIVERINAITANPLEEAKLYGKRTGKCCVCGIKLTNQVSVENGIGPICESNWGM